MTSSLEDVPHFMEVRGIGIIDIEKLYGIRAIRLQKRLEVVVELIFWNEIEGNIERLGLEYHTTQILGVDIPIIRLPVAPGKSVATIVEVLAMNHMLKEYGYNPASELSNLVDQSIKRKFETGFYLDSDFE